MCLAVSSEVKVYVRGIEMIVFAPEPEKLQVVLETINLLVHILGLKVTQT